MAQCPGPDPQLTIVLLGGARVGKSASGNTILGRTLFKSALSWGPVTTKIQEETGNVLGKLIRVIDTPGISSDIQGSEKELKTFCQDLLQSSSPLLFLVVIKTDRFTDEEDKTVQAAIRVLGDEGLANSFLLFTGGDDLNMSLQEYISQSKRSSLQGVVKKFGERYHLFSNEDHKDQNQVRELLEKADRLRARELPGFKAEGVSIVLLGNTAVGKSASGNTILGRAAFESKASLKPVTTAVREETGRRFGKRITVIDTPGILGSEGLIETCCLGLPRSSTPVLSLVVVRVGRFTEEDQQAVEAAIRVIGPRLFGNSYLLFTGGDALKDKTLQDFISEDDGGPLHQLVRRFSGRTHLFNNEDGGREQVRDLLQKAADPLTASVTLLDRRIVLIGLSGGGRSSAGNTILGSERFPTGSGFEPVTAEVVSESAEVEGHWITVVDTPGFTVRDSDEAQLYQRFEMMRQESEPGLHAVVFVVRIGRMSREDSVLLKALKDMFHYCPNFSMVLFTHGDELRGRSFDQMIQSNRCVSQLVSKSRNRFCVFDNSKRENREQVREFLHHVDNIVAENEGEHFDLDIDDPQTNWLNEKMKELSVAQIMDRHRHRHRRMAMDRCTNRSIDLSLFMNRDRSIDLSLFRDRDRCTNRSIDLSLFMNMDRDRDRRMNRHKVHSWFGISEHRSRERLIICCGCFCSVAGCVERVYRQLSD